MKTCSKIKRLKIGNTDVFLENFEPGRGKIIVSDLKYGSYSHFWGSMGSDLETFLLQTDESYFSMKLLPVDKQSVFDSKSTATAIRKFFRKDFQSELPWYAYQSAQKEMRAEIKYLENASSEQEFVDMCYGLIDRIICFDMDYTEEKEFKSIIRGVFEDEPWNFIQRKPSQEYKFLCEFLGNLKRNLQKQLS